MLDGRVEITAEGDNPNIAAFIEWCRRGPHWARVDDLDITEETTTGEFDEFIVRRDA
jgi:acylphosphatase